MASPNRRPASRFKIGDRVRFVRTLGRRLPQQQGVIVAVLVNRHSRTLDKYVVQVDDDGSEFNVFDVELAPE